MSYTVPHNGIVYRISTIISILWSRLTPCNYYVFIGFILSKGRQNTCFLCDRFIEKTFVFLLSPARISEWNNNGIKVILDGTLCFTITHFYGYISENTLGKVTWIFLSDHSWHELSPWENTLQCIIISHILPSHTQNDSCFSLIHCPTCTLPVSSVGSKIPFAGLYCGRNEISTWCRKNSLLSFSPFNAGYCCICFLKAVGSDDRLIDFYMFYSNSHPYVSHSWRVYFSHPYKVWWYEITYLFPNFNGCTIEV